MEAKEKMQLCKDGLMELYDKAVDLMEPEIYGALMGLHQLADEALAALKEQPCQRYEIIEDMPEEEELPSLLRDYSNTNDLIPKPVLEKTAGRLEDLEGAILNTLKKGHEQPCSECRGSGEIHYESPLIPASATWSCSSCRPKITHNLPLDRPVGTEKCKRCGKGISVERLNDGICITSCQAKPDIHPEDYCDECGGENITWHTDNDLWNKVVEKNATFNGKSSQILCITCFVKMAEKKGITTTSWRLSFDEVGQAKPESGELVKELRYKGGNLKVLAHVQAQSMDSEEKINAKNYNLCADLFNKAAARIKYQTNHIKLLREGEELLTKLVERLEQQLREGLHCQSFDMCGDAHDDYEKQIKQLEAEKAEREIEKTIDNEAIEGYRLTVPRLEEENERQKERIDELVAENKRQKEHIQKLEQQLGLCKNRFESSNLQADNAAKNERIAELEKYEAFILHIEKHLNNMELDEPVICTLCGKTIEQIQALEKEE